MPNSAFIEYNVSEACKLGIDINQLSNVLSRGKRGESVELTTEEGRLIVKFYADKRKRTFKIPLLDIGEGVQKEPKIEFKSYAKVKSEALKETLKDAKLVSSHVKLILEKDRFKIEVRGENGEVKAEFEKGGTEIDEIQTEKEVRATFPLQYLEDMVKASGGNSAVKINLETDRPLKLEYDVEGATVVYYLAPRIETE
jgi:proliferating cell nuclear antigen